MTNALYNKWRPHKWEQIVGQQHVVQTLKNAVAGNHVAHAYLFAGPRGTGKTTAARLLAKAVNCLNEDLAAAPCNICAHCQAVNENRFLDMIEIDAASTNSVDDVRDLREKINFTPNQGKYKVYIIDEVHMLSGSAFNALLKTLEEPPPHAIFILATTEMAKIPATVLSRCQRHEFRRVPVDDIVAHLMNIAKAEKIKAQPDALMLIARQSAGGVRDAISLLDLMASTGREITLELTQTVLGTATSQTVLALVKSILEREPAAGMDAIHAALDSGSDPRQLARQVVDYMRALLLFQMGNASQVDMASDVRHQAEEHAKAFSPAMVLGILKAFNSAATDLRGGWQPSLPLELAVAEVMELSAPAEEEIQAATQKPAVKPKPVKPAPSPQPDPKEDADPQGAVTLETINQAWKQIRGIIKPQNPSLDGLLNSCKPVGLKGNILTLGFASENVVKLMTNKPRSIEDTCKVINELFGTTLTLELTVINSKQLVPAEVKADGMVAAAIKAGGKIVDIQE